MKLTEKTTSDFYDFIIVDEFHHAAAPSYQKLTQAEFYHIPPQHRHPRVPIFSAGVVNF